MTHLRAILFGLVIPLLAGAESVVDIGIKLVGNHHEINWDSELGYCYTIEKSHDMVTWEPFNHWDWDSGTGQEIRYAFLPDDAIRFYRVVSSPAPDPCAWRRGF